jgi:hypothetical protein
MSAKTIAQIALGTRPHVPALTIRSVRTNMKFADRLSNIERRSVSVLRNVANDDKDSGRNFFTRDRFIDK